MSGLELLAPEGVSPVLLVQSISSFVPFVIWVQVPENVVVGDVASKLSEYGKFEMVVGQGFSVENTTEAENADTEVLHLVAACTSYSVFEFKLDNDCVKLAISVIVDHVDVPVSLYLIS